MANRMHQLLLGKNCAVIHEYLFSNLERGRVFPRSEVAFHLRHVAPGSFKLATLHMSDGDVCRASRVPDVKPSQFKPQ